MKVIALLILVSAWGCLLFAPAGTASRVLQMLVFGALGALPVGLLVLAIGLSLGGTTGYAINPARDLGPRLAHALLPIPGKGDGDWSYAWIPVVGPIIGALLAAAVFAGMQMTEAAS